MDRIFFLFLCGTITNAKHECPHRFDDCDVCLSNSDFDAGTYRIREAGKYCLSENIYFNPLEGSLRDPNLSGFWSPIDEEEYPGCSTQSDGPFALGYFAAISIESSNVELDLRGFCMQQHWYHYLQQRFFSLIEVGSSPFLPGTGPANFGNQWISVDNVTIHSGELGLSSHHGVHSQGATHLTLRDLVVNEFEVAGIALNGFSQVCLKNLEIGPSLSHVPFTGFYSNARFLVQALRSLLNGIDKDKDAEMPKISFSYLRDGDFISLEDVYFNLLESMDLAFRWAANQQIKGDTEHPLYGQAIDLFINDEGLPDGSAIYGLIMHSHNVAVNGFGQSLNEEGHGEEVEMENINIHNLKLKLFEIPAMFFDKCNGNDQSVTILRGPFGDVMDIRAMIKSEYVKVIDEYDVNGMSLDQINYEGNVVSDAQIALFLYGDLIGEENYSFGSHLSSEFLRWAVRGYDGSYEVEREPIADCIDFVCNGDIMFHTNKGVIGLRLDLIEDVKMKNIQIRNLTNLSPLASCACANYSGPHDGGNPGTRERQGSMGTDLRGISIFGGDVWLEGDKNVIHNLQSHFGDVAGIDLMDDAILEYAQDSSFRIEEIVSAVNVDGSIYRMLSQINKTPYPNNFKMCRINAQDEAQVINEENAQYFECVLPEFMRKYTEYPTNEPTLDPILQPTSFPTLEPTFDPTNDPTVEPTFDPTVQPSSDPTFDPSMDPTIGPTHDPSIDPTLEPTLDPITFSTTS